MTHYSELEARLRAGQIVVTGEVAPPKGCDIDAIERHLAVLRGAIDAVNFTDNQRGLARMSSLGASIMAAQAGFETVMQMTCQNRNRIALQGDVLSANALGIGNFLCMTGDHPRHGDHPEAKSVLDLNSFQLLRMLRKMRDEGALHAGTALKHPPRMFIGAVANPNLEKVKRLEAKLDAGAEFIQTQPIYDVALFRQYMAEARERELHKRAFILAGILLLKSPRTALYIRDKLPGQHIPESIVDRMNGASDPEVEGLAIASELTRELLDIEGVAGIHIMSSVNWSSAMPEVIARCGLLPRPAAPQMLRLPASPSPLALLREQRG
jgi:methylenetetrahydrofolate reductase (NADPH)